MNSIDFKISRYSVVITINLTCTDCLTTILIINKKIKFCDYIAFHYKF